MSEASQSLFGRCDCALTPLLQGLPGMLCVRPLDGAIVYLSAACRELLGVERTALMGRHDGFAGLMSDDEHARVIAEIRNQLATSQGYQVRYQLRRADGESITIDEGGVAWCDERGQLRGVCGYLSDVSAQVSQMQGMAAELGQRRQLQQELTSQVSQLSAQLAELEIRSDQRQRRMRALLKQVQRWQQLLEQPEALSDGVPEEALVAVADALQLGQAHWWRLSPDRSLLQPVIRSGTGVGVTLTASQAPLLFRALNDGMVMTFVAPTNLGLAAELGAAGISTTEAGYWLLLPLPCGGLLVQRKGGAALQPEEQLGLTAVGLMLTLLLERLDARQARHQLSQLAYFDPLTQLENRRLFLQQLQDALIRQRREGFKLAVLFMDLDGFKQVNDQHGHEIGDRLLAAVARRLKGVVRGTDHCARLGGDEFVIMLHQIRDNLAAAEVARKLVDAIAVPFQLDGVELRLQVSIGIAMAPEDSQDVGALLRLADTAMYKAKRGGIGGYAFADGERGAQALRSQTLSHELLRALEEGQFNLQYLPQVDLAGGRIAGAEALLRWQHPQRGLLAPHEFAAEAERGGLWPRLGDWVGRQVCIDRRELGDNNAFLSFNLSLPELTNRRLMQRLLERLAERSHDGIIRVDLSESALRLAPRQLEGVLRDFGEARIGISLDDVGSGWLPLAWLEAMPIDTLKVDGRLVRRAALNGGAALVAAVCAVGTELGKQIVAEGVEEAGWLPSLSAHGCTAAQGYYFYRPMAFGELKQLMSGLH